MQILKVTWILNMPRSCTTSCRQDYEHHEAACSEADKARSWSG